MRRLFPRSAQPPPESAASTPTPSPPVSNDGLTILNNWKEDISRRLVGRRSNGPVQFVPSITHRHMPSGVSGTTTPTIPGSSNGSNRSGSTGSSSVIRDECMDPEPAVSVVSLPPVGLEELATRGGLIPAKTGLKYMSREDLRNSIDFDTLLGGSGGSGQDGEAEPTREEPLAVGPAMPLPPVTPPGPHVINEQPEETILSPLPVPPVLMDPCNVAPAVVLPQGTDLEGIPVAVGVTVFSVPSVPQEVDDIPEWVRQSEQQIAAQRNEEEAYPRPPPTALEAESASTALQTEYASTSVEATLVDDQVTEVEPRTGAGTGPMFIDAAAMAAELGETAVEHLTTDGDGETTSDTQEDFMAGTVEANRAEQTEVVPLGQVLSQVVESGVEVEQVGDSTLIQSKNEDGTICVPLNTETFETDSSKVENGETVPSLESMMMLAAHEVSTDLDSSDAPIPAVVAEESECEWFPLSMARTAATSRDGNVYNDLLKVVMVAPPDVGKSSLALAIRNSSKVLKPRATLGVEVHSWTPDEKSDIPIKLMIWDVQGATETCENTPNFGAHFGTQSLFFSGSSLYILVTDLGWKNPDTHVEQLAQEEYEAEDGQSSRDDASSFTQAQAQLKAKQALRGDYHQRVLCWIATIARCAQHSAILPVALTSPDMSDEEIDARCEVLQETMEEHVNLYEGNSRPTIVLDPEDKRGIICVNSRDNSGIRELQQMMLLVARDDSGHVFDHIGTEVPDGAEIVLNSVRKFKTDYKLVPFDCIFDDVKGAVQGSLDVEMVKTALKFLATIGEVMYYGDAEDDVLSRYVILSRKWLVSALSCVLRNNLRQEISDTRRYMNMQNFSAEKGANSYVEHHIISSLDAVVCGSNCPILSDDDAKMLWQSMSFMREVTDPFSQLGDSPSANSMSLYIERLLVHTGVFLSLGVNEISNSIDERSEIYFVPSLLVQANPHDAWTYNSHHSFETTLCNTWLLHDGAPSQLMERITVNILRTLYRLILENRAKPHPNSAGRAVSEAGPSDDPEETEGYVKIRKITCWRSALLLKIGTKYPDPASGSLVEIGVEIFVAIVDQSSDYCVATDQLFTANKQRVIVSGRGPVGNCGERIWNGGYDLVVRSVSDSLADIDDDKKVAQVVCPDCLAQCEARHMRTWNLDYLESLPDETTSERCDHGHRIDLNLLCGIGTRRTTTGTEMLHHTPSMDVYDIFPSVVVVAMWDAATCQVRNVGSGFVADKNLGLIVTAAHCLISMESGDMFGVPFPGCQDGRALIGVIPKRGECNAVFRYFGDIVAQDIHNCDACVVRITGRLENDVADEGAGVAFEVVQHIAPMNIVNEDLRPLQITTESRLDRSVRMVGFNQGGEGRFVQGKHVNRTADVMRGYIAKRFTVSRPVSNNDLEQGEDTGFVPRQELVVMCHTISGHSGGPCVNDEGRVVGVLSRADRINRERCYLVPSDEINILLDQAKASMIQEEEEDGRLSGP